MEGSTEWLQQSNLLCQIQGMEQLMFECSAKILFCRQGLVVVGNELLSSRAQDVETKAISDRKAGKEGLISDCIACSLTSMMYGMRLHTVADTQMENVEKVMETLEVPRNPSDQPLCLMDRGYGKMAFIDKIRNIGLEVITLAATVGSRQLFCTEEEYNRFANGPSADEKRNLRIEVGSK